MFFKTGVLQLRLRSSKKSVQEFIFTKNKAWIKNELFYKYFVFAEPPCRWLSLVNTPRQCN